MVKSGKPAAAEPTVYQYEVRYARWWAWLALVTGLAALPAAVVLALWLRVWAMPLVLLGFGSVLLASAYQRLGDAGPQLKFGPEGIWTAKLGFQPWRRVRAEVAGEPGTLVASTSPTLYVLVFDRHTGRLLDKLEATPLDMEVDHLMGNLRYYSRQGAK